MSLERNTPGFIAVLDAHKGIVYKVANAYCRDDANRQDLIQEIILQLWLSFPSYDESYRLSTWIYRIALNVSISFYRKESRRRSINQTLPPQILILPEERGGEIQTHLDRLYAFIRNLKELDRAIILLYLEENSHKEIADILGLTPTNISTRIMRIKQKLKKDFLQ